MKSSQGFVKPQDLQYLACGCSSGEEVISMAILLREMGIHNDVQLYATDLDTTILEKAKSATYLAKNMDLNEKNYIVLKANGR